MSVNGVGQSQLAVRSGFSHKMSSHQCTSTCKGAWGRPIPMLLSINFISDALSVIGFLSLATVLLLSPVANASQASPSSNPSQSLQEQPVTLDHTVEWRMTNNKGHDYRILISKPEGELPYSGGYPVIYILDGNAYFASFHEAKRAQRAFQKAIIVGIAYPGIEPHNFLRRSYDFSPLAMPDSYPPQGGQDELLSFIEQQLMPAVDERFTVDPHNQSLVGHSFAGMFALYTLFTRPDLFDQIVSVSPSLWWKDRFLLKHENDFTQRVQKGKTDVTHRNVQLWVAKGDSAQDRQDLAQLATRLDGLSRFGLRSAVQQVAEEDHMSVPFSIESNVLKQLLHTRR